VISRAGVLQLALHEAVDRMGGLGGLVHVRGPERSHELVLAASVGLPAAFTETWQRVPLDASAAPAAAARLDRPTWYPTPGGLGAGMASVALPSPPGEVAGSLTVVMPGGEPAAGKWDRLTAVARWAAGLLPYATLPDAPHETPSGTSEPVSDQVRTAEPGAAEAGAWVWDIETGRLSLGDRLLALLGIDAAEYDGHVKAWLSAVHPDDLAWVAAETDKAISTLAPCDIEYRVRRPDGSTRWVRVRGRAEPDADGRPCRMLGTAWDSTQAHAAAPEETRQPPAPVTDGYVSLDTDWRITFASLEAERLLGLPSRLSGQVAWDQPAFRQMPGLEERCRSVAAGAAPAVFVTERPETGRRYRFRLVPVRGGLFVHFTDATTSRQLRAGQAAAGQAARVQDLTAALAEAVTSRDVVTAVASHVLPPFGASGLLVEVAKAGHLRVVGAVGYPQAYVEFVDGLELRDAPTVAAAIDEHRPFFLSSPAEHAERFPELAGWLDPNGKQAWAFLPLVVSGQAVGLCIISFDWPRSLLGAERALLIALSGLIAQALERARLFDAEHAQAQELQQALLPRMLPSLPGVTAAARYVPGAGATIGGDWYDVIPLSADRVALVIGDVMGHGLSEAVIMGRLRTAVQTLSDLELPPDEILSHLNDVVAGMGDDCFVTCLYAIYDPVTRTCAYARAGHLPAAVVRPDGTVRFTQDATDPPLGVAEPPFETSELAVPDQSLLVLYTDGLIETRRSDLKAAMGRLAGLLRRHHDQDPDQLCDSLTDGLLPDGQQNGDDAALLVVRAHATPAEAIATWSLPEDPRAASAARVHIRSQLATWGLEELTASTEMVASELVANVVRHAHGPVRLRLLRSRTLVCEVFDGSVTTPRIRRTSWTDEGGRGLQLVAALCDRWGTRYLTSGKSIWTEQSLP
jgi:PAS domain S-box-containing protein